MLGVGAGLYFALPREPDVSLGWLAGAAGIALALAAIRTERLRVILALLAALMLGFGAAKLHESAVAAPVLARPVTIHLTARIVGIEGADAGIRLLLADAISGGF